MNNFASTSKENAATFADDIFEDSSILANFNNTSFRETTSKVPQNNLNDSHKSELNVSALCCDEEINGYDKLTGHTWIYPTNYPVRDYQFNIIKAAILQNTLVSLPTGLGKTFIAAVIMYNYYRWYPLGKIVFTAPTRPLVAQQIEACYNIIAIPPSDTVEMTGHMQVNTRKAHWQTKRVFFATPQVIYNDIKSGICPGDLVRCLVIDEAHRARGNYAYCQIVATLTDLGHRTYRLLALSATPGSKVDDVVNVVKNLHIAHLELRTENCIDVAPYSHARRINTVIVQLGPELTYLRQQYVEIMDTYARRLKQLNILPHNLGNLSKGRVVMLYKEFQNKDRGARHPQHNYIMKDFTLLIALYHGLELLVKHGSRVFLNFFDDHPEKSWIQSDDKLTALLERLRDDLGVNPLSLDRSILPDGTIPELPKNLCFGHPKFYKLKEIMLEHFHRAKENGQDTRAIVFCEYRESVNLVHCLLLQCRPLITAQMFVGQGASGKDGKTMVSQKQQLRVMRSFRSGACNTLVATCVAEEGLDVGSVDLILCFDISTRSPIRLVQRCGRTGRERGGQVHILVTEGREHQTLLDCIRQRDGLNKKILQSREVQNGLYAQNPRMMPRDHTPVCKKMFITVANKEKDGDKAKKGQKDLRTMLLGKRSSSSSSSSSKEMERINMITEEEFNRIFPDGYCDTANLEQPKELWAMSRETIKSLSENEESGRLKLSTWLEWQRSLQKTVNIDHSTDTEILASLLQYSDAKRFDMPASTQNPCFNTQDFATQNIAILFPAKASKISSPAKMKQTKKKQKILFIKSPSKKDGDIRALFSTATKSTTNYTKLINDLGVQYDGSIPTRLLNLLVDISVDNKRSVKSCYICQNVCDCSILQNMKNLYKPPIALTIIKELKLPDLDLIDDIDLESIMKCRKKNDESKDLEESITDSVNYLSVDNKHNCSKNFDLEFDFDLPINLISPEKEQIHEPCENPEKNFDIGDIDDIFADSSPEEAIKKEMDKTNDKNSSNPKQTLGFFGLNSIDDIFADSDESVNHTCTKTPEKIENCDTRPINRVFQTSPSILTGRQKTHISTSPILGSQVRKFKLTTKKNQPQSSTPVSNVRRQLISDNSIVFTPEHHEIKTKSIIQNSLAHKNNKSLFTITQMVEMINKTGDDNIPLGKSNIKLKTDTSINADNRSTSPILLTQADRRKSSNNTSESNVCKVLTSEFKKCESLIILESDSDSQEDTQLYDLDEENNENIRDVPETKSCVAPQKMNIMKVEDTSKVLNTIETLSPICNKRKLETDVDVTTNSPYFNKKPKLNKTDDDNKTLTLQEKIMATLTSNKLDKNVHKNDFNVEYVFSPRKRLSQKENNNPQFMENGHQSNNSDDEKEYVRKSNLEMLQMFRRVKKADNRHEACINSRTLKPNKRKISSDESDDFIDDHKSNRNRSPANSGRESNGTTNHKVRKKKRKGNPFLDLEAELSDDSRRDSGDELSDDSVGSIVDFICDDNLTHHEDMQAHYLRSITSPVKGVFKIPQLPNKYNKAEVFSQYVEEDSYEMDSFCVDSHVGLTQINDVSDLDAAEEMLLEQRKLKKKSRSGLQKENEESPIFKRNNRKVKRLVDSDSSDSS